MLKREVLIMQQVLVAEELDASPPASKSVMAFLVCGVLGAAAGAFLVLASISYSAKSYADLTAERDALTGENRQLTRKNADLTQQMAHEKSEAEKTIGQLRQQLAETQKKAATSATELAWYRSSANSLMDDLLKCETLVGMMRDSDAVVTLVRSQAFRQNFKCAWHWPQTAMQLMGSLWFAEELIRSGVLSPSDATLKVAPFASLAAPKWRVRKHWSSISGAKSETFEIASPIWRVSWNADPKGIDISVYFQDDPDVVAYAGGAGKGASILRTGPGSYYLGFSGGQSEITIEEPDVGN
jgi:hypothetical protein